MKPWLDTIQAVLAVAGVVAGYYWFTEQRLSKPNIKLDQFVTQREVANNKSLTLITLELRATNIGKIGVKLPEGNTQLLQINPPAAGSPASISFPLPADAEFLEPGESEQTFFKTITIPNDIRTLQIHSAYRVPGSKNRYWDVLNAVDIGNDESKTSSAQSH